MKKDTRIALTVMIAIIVAIAVSGNVFHIDLSYHLSAIGGWFVILLPWYVWHRLRRNNEEMTTQGRATMAEMVIGKSVGLLKKTARGLTANRFRYYDEKEVMHKVRPTLKELEEDDSYQRTEILSVVQDLEDFLAKRGIAY